MATALAPATSLAAPPAVPPGRARPPVPPPGRAGARPPVAKPPVRGAVRPASTAISPVLVVPRFVKMHPLHAHPADRELYERLCAEVGAGYDSARGGFVGRDGRPNEAAIELAFARGRDGDAQWQQRAMRSLTWTRQLLDTVGGGYVDGIRDMDPRQPGFEKHTIPNARRLELLTLAGALPGGRAWRRDQSFVEDHFERVLQDPRGGFFTGQIAMADLEPESNGVGLQAWWRAGAAAADPSHRDFARRTFARLWGSSHHPELGMVRRDRLGTIREPSILLDQVEVGRAHLLAWQVTANDSDLIRARFCADHVLSHFEDAKKGGFRTDYAADRFGRARRARRAFDDNARTCRFLVELSAATGDPAYAHSARRAWIAFDREFARSRMDAAEWALAVRSLWAPEPLPIVRWKDRSRGNAMPRGVAEAGAGR